jgi:hypothetical protein
MLKPIDKLVRQPLVHHPSDALDAFCHYDATNPSWLEFDDSLSQQLIQLELNNRQYIRIRPRANRRSVGS